MKMNRYPQQPWIPPKGYPPPPPPPRRREPDPPPAEPPDDKHVLPVKRIGDADRDKIINWLHDAHATGHLTETELDARIDWAMAAQTGEQLNKVTADLPAPAPPAEPEPENKAPSRAASSLLSLLGVAIGLLVIFTVHLHGPGRDLLTPLDGVAVALALLLFRFGFSRK